GGDDGRIRLVDLATERVLSLGALPSRILDIAWSPDGRLFAAADGNSCLRLFDARDGSPREGPDIVGSAACSLAWSPDGRRIAVGTYGFVAIWDVAEARVISRIGIDPGTLDGAGPEPEEFEFGPPPDHLPG